MSLKKRPKGNKTKLNLMSGDLSSLHLDFEVTLDTGGHIFTLEDRDLKNLMQRKFGLSPVVAGGVFNGVLDVSEVHDKFYTDYDSGSSVTLSLSSTKAMGSMCSVRVQGDLTNALPADWHFSGDTLSTSASDWNELTLLYVNDDDIRIHNRVFAQ